MIHSKKEYRYNIVSTTNPITITLPSDSSGNVYTTRTLKTLEIEDFHWMGSFSKTAQGKGDSTDIDNVPPLFFQIKISDDNVSGIQTESNINQKIMEFAKPRTQFDAIPTITAMTAREGGSTVDDYGGISYNFSKVVYGLDEKNLKEKLNISNVTTPSIILNIESVYSYIDANGATKYANGTFKFDNRPIQGLASVSEPFILRVLVCDE